MLIDLDLILACIAQIVASMVMLNFLAEDSAFGPFEGRSNKLVRIFLALNYISLVAAGVFRIMSIVHGHLGTMSEAEVEQQFHLGVVVAMTTAAFIMTHLAWLGHKFRQCNDGQCEL